MNQSATSPQGWLDLPLDGAACEGCVEILGWSFSPTAPIVRIEAFVAGRSLGIVSGERPRPDVALAHSLPSSAIRGFHQFLPLDRGEDGAVPLVVCVTDAAGGTACFERSIVVRPRKVYGWIDRPFEEESCVDGLSVAGWAFSTAGRIDRIEILLGERKLGRATHGYERFDVFADHPHAPCVQVGFRERFRLAGAETEVRRQILKARITDEAGNVLLVERPILFSCGAVREASAIDVRRIEIDDLMAEVRSQIALTRDPLPSADAKPAAVSFTASPEWTRATATEILDLLERIGVFAADIATILDFGLGSPRLLAELEQACRPCEVVAVSDSPHVVSQSAGRPASVSAFLLSPTPRLGWPDRHFDLIVDSGLLARMDRLNRRGWLAEIHRVLNPTGVALVNGLAMVPLPDGDDFRDWLPQFEVGTCLDGRGRYAGWHWTQRRREVGEVSSTGLTFGIRPGTTDASIVQSVLRDNEYRLPCRFGPDDVVIDVGAHIGSFSAAVLARGAGRVCAFEPDFGNWTRARSALRPFGDRVLVQRQAVWRSDRANVSLAISSYEGVGVVSNTGAVGVLSPTTPSATVSSIALDDVVDRVTGGRNRRVRLVKLDCEGSEFPILYTSNRLDRIDALCGEYHDIERILGAVPEIARVPSAEGYDGVALARFLRRKGFTVRLSPHGLLGLFFAWRPDSDLRFF